MPEVVGPVRGIEDDDVHERGDRFASAGPWPSGGRAVMARTPEADEQCVCGHPFAAHEHHRPGTECSLCGSGECDEFRDRHRRGLKRFLRRQ